MLAVLVATAAGTAGLPHGAAAARELLMPGVTYERQVQFTAHGPVAIHVLQAPKPSGLWRLGPYLSNGAILGRERVTTMQRTASRDATVAGVNGDLFTWEDGRPSGILVQAGALHHPPSPDRSSVGVAADGSLRVERVRYFGTWRGTGQRRPLDLNETPGPNEVSLFTRSWGPSTPALENALEVVLRPFPPATPNGELAGTVTEVRQGSAGGIAIPPDGAVLTAQGPTAQRLLAEAPLGSTVNVRLVLSPDWTDVPEALGGGPALVRAGKPIFRHGELFSPDQLARNPRTAVGQTRDGRILLVVVDGRQPGYSAGMTNFELAQTLVRLGAADGVRAGRRRLLDDGLRRAPAQPALRPDGRAPGLRRAVRLLLGRLRRAAGRAGALAQRRRRGRRPGLRVQAGAPVGGDRRARGPARRAASARLGGQGAGHVPFRLERPRSRRRRRGGGELAAERDRDRRPRPQLARRSRVLAQSHALPPDAGTRAGARRARAADGSRRGSRSPGRRASR